jgi:hypothetical protein
MRGKVSRSLIDIASRLIACAMAALTIAITLNMFFLASVVLESQIWGLVFGIGAFMVFSGLWFGYPMLTRQRKLETCEATTALLDETSQAWLCCAWLARSCASWIRCEKNCAGRSLRSRWECLRNGNLGFTLSRQLDDVLSSLEGEPKKENTGS